MEREEKGMGSAIFSEAFSESLRVPTYKITVTDGGSVKYRFACRGDEPLLAAIRRACCAEIPRGCFGGGCGVCKVVIRSGAAKQFKPMSREHISEGELAQSAVLACCVRPRSDMEICFFRDEPAQTAHMKYEGAYGEARTPAPA